MNTHIPTLSGGGNVLAIIPQTFEETFRIARAVVAAGLAPSSLIGKKTGDDAASAVAVCIMSGAELGLKPMVSLRSFTVINGKPALYGDGIINVVRQSGKVAFLKTGHEIRDGKMVGFCHAKRRDTDEESRVEFSQAEAERAGLWDDRPLVRKQVWENNQKVWKDNQPNDATWYRYPQRMLAWRAAGYCLRELFGDVLGGIRDEFEEREIAHANGDEPEMRDITPSSAQSAKKSLMPPRPPKASAEPAKDEQSTLFDDQQQKPSESEFDLGEFMENLETSLAGAKDEASIEEIWTDIDVEAVLADEGHDDMITAAFAIKTRRLAQINPMNGG